MTPEERCEDTYLLVDQAREVWLTDDGQYLDTPPAPLSDYQPKGA